MTYRTDLQYEFRLHEQGCRYIAGLDEAGRGCWAGPVVAGAVILPLERFDLAHALTGVTDSKLLSPETRDSMIPKILQTAAASGVGFATNDEIDQIGIVPATRLAMRRALAQLELVPDALLIDSLELPEIDLPCTALIKGDQKSVSIAAASILAKVARDQHLNHLDTLYPQYGFRLHKGYGTELHRHALETFGVTDVHRQSFAPVRRIIKRAARHDADGDHDT